jgi:hypothetical protein
MSLKLDFTIDLNDIRLVTAMAYLPRTAPGDPPPDPLPVDHWDSNPLEEIENARSAGAVRIPIDCLLVADNPQDSHFVEFTDVCVLGVGPKTPRGVQNTTSVSSPVHQRVSIEVRLAAYSTGANAVQQAALVQALAPINGLDPTSLQNFDFDAIEASLAAQGITEELYHIGCIARISRIGAPTPHTILVGEQPREISTCEELRRRYPNAGDLVDYPDGRLPGENVRLSCSACEYSAAPPMVATGPNIKEYENIGSGDEIPAPIAEDIKQLATKESQHLDCNGAEFEVVPKRLCTVFVYPEFRVEPAFKVWKIRIFRKTIRIRITYLQLQIRWTKIALFGFSRINMSVDRDETLRKILNCLLEAFLLSAIASFALGNPAAAAPVFNKAFVNCVKGWAVELLACLVVGIFFAKEKNDNWSPV